MTDLMPFVVAGIVAGSLYGLAATGLVLTYKTSGVFNFAHGATGAAAAYIFYDLRDLHGQPAWLAAVLTVGVAAPLFGLVLSVLAGRLAHTSTARRVVATVGVLLVIQGLIQLRFGVTPLNLNTSLPITSLRIADVNVGYDQIITVAISVLGVLLLGGLFRYTRSGLEMQAVVDNPLLLDLAGQAPARVRARAWMIGSAFAAASGILLAPTVGLDALVLTLIVVQAFGAAAVGRFERIGTTFMAAAAIGIVQNLLNAPRVQDLLPFTRSLPGLDQAVPFLVLFAVLVLTPTGSFREGAAPRIPRVASHLSRRTRAGLAAATVAVVILLPFVADTRLPVLTMGAVFVTIYASLFLLVEVSNQVSLCHVAFVAIGAVTFCHLTVGQGLPWIVGVVAAGLVAVPVGAIVAVPSIRLSGLFLALATFGFGILVEKLLYTRELMFGKSGTLRGNRPDLLGLGGDRGYFYLCAAVGLVAIALVLVIGRGRLGRLLRGLADSPIALATHGLTINVTRVIVFCVSAAMAGVAGALYVGVVGYVSSVGASSTALVSFNSLVWLVTLSFVGRRPALSPLLAALALVVGPSYVTSPNTTEYLTIGFGLVAVISATFGETVLRRMADSTVTSGDRLVRSPVRLRTAEARMEVAGG
jgi:branched-subunit amino acid ABC-type transport system permease component